MTLLHHHHLAALFAVWVVVVSNDAASALQVRAVVGHSPRQRILPPSIQPNSNFFHNKNRHNNVPPLHRRPNKLLAAFTKLDASVAFDDESYYSSRGGGTQRASLIAAATSAAASSSRMIRWPLLGGLLLLAMRQAHPIVVPLLKSLIQSYDQSMIARPLITKVLTGAVLATLGDTLAQCKTARSSTATGATAVRYDPRRAASFAAFDSCYRCFQHYAFPTVIATCRGNFLGRFFSMFFSSSLSAESLHLLAVAERTLVYQLAVVPLLYYPVFFLFTGFMQGLNLSQTLERAKNNFIPCWKRNLLFWIPIQTLMFGWIQEQWQIPFVCVMGILWSSILSTTAGKATAATTMKTKYA